MRRRSIPVLLVLALAASILRGFASEPEGRAAIRYEWIGDRDAARDGRRLRLTVTALVPLEDAHLEASAPSGVGAFVRQVELAPAGSGESWPTDGLVLGGLLRGATAVIELDVVEPVKGGEILTFSLRALENGRAMVEAVGVPVGTPGIAPVLRNGAVEFPAARLGTGP